MMTLTRKRLAFWLGAIVMALGFFSNQWGVVQSDYFRHFQADSDALVYGGLAHCASLGPSRHGLWAAFPSEAGFEDREWGPYTQSMWLNHSSPRTWVPYTSQIGLQGWIACYLYRIAGRPSPGQFISALEMINSGLLALFAATILVWVRSLAKDTGMAIPVALVTFSPWLTQIGSSVYWVSWTWFLPMVAAIALARRWPDGVLRYRPRDVFIALAVAVFVKSACGYEFISFALVAMMLPFLWRFMETAPRQRSLWNDLAVPAVAGLAGFLGAVLLHAVLRTETGQIIEGLSAIFADAARRTSTQLGSDAALPEVVLASLRVPVSDVIQIYAKLPIVALPWGLAFSALACVAAILLTSALLGFRWLRRRSGDPESSCSAVSLGVLAIAGAAAPLSWFILAKGHSYIHQTINPVLWVLPMLPLTLAFVAIAVPDKLGRLHVGGFGRGAGALIVILLLELVGDNLVVYAQARGGARVPSAFSAGRIIAFRSGNDVVFLSRSPDHLDWDAKFFVHVYPTSVADLPSVRQQHGYDNLDFEPARLAQGMPPWSIYSGSVIFRRTLPSIYKIDHIEVGQYRLDTGRQLWSEQLRD